MVGLIPIIMIPYLPKDVNPLDVPPFYRQILDNLKIRSGHHEAWHTHKRDTSVCWICDLLELSSIVVGEMEQYISKSALDIDEQFHGSEVFSDEGDELTDHESDQDDSPSYNRQGDI